MPNLKVQVLGDEQSLLRAYKNAANAGRQFTGTVKEQVEQTIVAHVKEKKSLQDLANEYGLVARNAKKGSEVQVVAARLAAEAQSKLGRSYALTAHESAHMSRNGFGKTAEHDLSRTARGAVAASGAFRGLGRSVAFASGYFLGGAGIVYALKTAVDNAESFEKAQRSLSVTIKKTGGNVEQILPGIERWAKAQASVGVTAAEAEQGLARASAVTGSAVKGQRAYTEALLISKATGKNFNSVLLAAAKANNGSTTALARYIGKIKTGTTAQKLYNDVVARYKGQAEANTTATEKLRASLSNVELIVGTALLPTLNHYASALSDWLGKSRNQERVQRDVNTVVHEATSVIHALSTAAKTVSGTFGGWKRVLGALLALKVASTLGGWAGAFKSTGGAASTASGEVAILRGKLKALSTLAPIIITVTLLEQLIPPKVTKGGQKILDKEGLGFLGHLPVIGPVIQSGADAGRSFGKGLGINYGKGDTVPKQYGKSPAMREAYQAGQQGNAYPFNLAAMNAGPLLAAYLAGRKKSKVPVGSNTTTTTKPPPAKPPVAPLDNESRITDAVAAARVAVARGESGAKQRLKDALQQQIAFDAKYAAIQKKLAERGGKDAKAHADTYKRLAADEASAYDEIHSLDKKDENAAKRAAAKRAAALKRADRAFLAYWRITVTEARSKGEDAVLGALRRERTALKKRLQSEKGNLVLQQALADTNDRIAKIVQKKQTFTEPFKFQLADARSSAAVAAAGLTSSLNDDDAARKNRIKVDQAYRKWLLKMIKAHKFMGQALIDAWNEVARTDDDIAGLTNKTTQHVVASSSRLLTAGLNLTAAQRQALEGRYADALAHGGRMTQPGEYGANGVYINTVHVNGVTDVKGLSDKITKHAKRNTGQSRGTRPGSYLGHH